MSEQDRAPIVDFHLGAFNTEVAIAYGYTTHGTPRTPAVRLYTEHRAHSNWRDVEASRIHWGDERLRKLGLTTLDHALNDQDRYDAQPIRFTLRRVARIMRERVGV